MAQVKVQRTLHELPEKPRPFGGWSRTLGSLGTAKTRLPDNSASVPGDRPRSRSYLVDVRLPRISA